MSTRQFLVRKDRLREHRQLTLPESDLAPGGAELRVDRFGLTANNITYGVMGDAMSYWKFFPTAEEGWGILPVWGFGTVTRSDAPGLAVGDRFYGYFPMASHVIVEPKRISPVGFLDGAAHRRGLSGVYNQYLRTTADGSYQPDTELVQVVLRPLYATAYFLADFLAEHDFFGAEEVVLSSASSKLACSTALALLRPTIGLTSTSNADFVKGLGFYDRVIRYDEIDALERRRAVYIDIAGSAPVRAAVHRHYGDTLTYSSSVGVTHWDALAPGQELPGPRPIFFFAPDWIKRRTVDWGPDEVQKRLATGWNGIVEKAGRWLNLVEVKGDDAITSTYDRMVEGHANPRDGFVLSL